MKSVGYILWHAKHEITHVILGILWAWYLSGWWGAWHIMWFIAGGIAGLLPDADHIYYFVMYGRNDPYSQTVRVLWKKKRWMELVLTLQQGHKKNTHLMLHNFFTILLLLFCLWVVLLNNMRLLVILIGALLSHFLFDVVEDVVLLKKINANWFRWGRSSI